MNPTKISKEQLIDFLKYITELIEKDDSYEGRFEYHAIENTEDPTKKTFECDFAVRYDNLLGQGGVMIPPDTE